MSINLPRNLLTNITNFLDLRSLARLCLTSSGSRSFCLNREPWAYKFRQETGLPLPEIPQELPLITYAREREKFLFPKIQQVEKEFEQQISTYLMSEASLNEKGNMKSAIPDILDYLKDSIEWVTLEDLRVIVFMQEDEERAEIEMIFRDDFNGFFEQNTITMLHGIKLDPDLSSEESINMRNQINRPIVGYLLAYLTKLRSLYKEITKLRKIVNYGRIEDEFEFPIIFDTRDEREEAHIPEPLPQLLPQPLPQPLPHLLHASQDFQDLQQQFQLMNQNIQQIQQQFSQLPQQPLQPLQQQQFQHFQHLQQQIQQLQQQLPQFPPLPNQQFPPFPQLPPLQQPTQQQFPPFPQLPPG